MRPAFYDSESYRTKQSEITRYNHRKGVYANNRRIVLKTCVREGCEARFETQPASRKRYCGSSCAARVSNANRYLRTETRKKISEKLKGKRSPFKGMILVPRLSSVCGNAVCGKAFVHERHRSRKFCSRTCAFKVINSRPTSAKASRGKSGIRPDIHPQYYFHSRWEANIARLYSYLGVEWVYEPRTFDLGSRTYTPDFYLPRENTYIEVKNFWNKHSEGRDLLFRMTYPEITLKVILKPEYLQLEHEYARQIPSWEYRNSPVPAR